MLPYGPEPKGTIALLSGYSHRSPHPFSVFLFFCFILQHSLPPLLPFSSLQHPHALCKALVPMSWMGLLL